MVQWSQINIIKYRLFIAMVINKLIVDHCFKRFDMFIRD